MNINECEVIYLAAVAAKACKGNIEAARRYLDAGDVEGFERVCRGNRGWLDDLDIPYNLTDGPAEAWHDNGVLSHSHTYVNGKLEGIYKEWHLNGILRQRCVCKGGKREGLYESWNGDGTLKLKITYVNGEVNSSPLWVFLPCCEVV